MGAVRSFWFIDDLTVQGIKLFGKIFSSWINRRVDITNLWKRPKSSSLDFVNEVIGFVRAFDEIRSIFVDSQLHLHSDLLTIEQIYQNVLRTLSQPVFDSYYL